MKITIYGVVFINRSKKKSNGCLGQVFAFIFILFIMMIIKVYSIITGYFEEKDQKELNGLYLDYINSVRPTFESKLFSIKDLGESSFYKTYKEDFDYPISQDMYDSPSPLGESIVIHRESEANVSLHFDSSTNSHFDIMEQEFPQYYLDSFKFETESVLAEEDKQFLADLLTTVGYPTTAQDLKNVGQSNLDEVPESHLIEEVSDDACYQTEAYYSIYDQKLFDGEWENIYDLEHSFAVSCSIYPFHDVWEGLEDIERTFELKH